MSLKRLVFMMTSVLLIFSVCINASADAIKSGFVYENNIWNYYNENGAISSLQGIDVSYYQGDINWNEVKAAGISFAFVRAGFRGYGSKGNMREDEKFKQNITGAYNAGIKVGVYFYSQSITVAEAIEEARFTLALIEPYRNMITYPVVYDTEYCSAPDARTNVNPISSRLRTDMAAAFVKEIRKNGYTPAIYASPDWLENSMNKNETTELCDIWIAHWISSKPTSFSPFTVWQYTSSGTVNGISGSVDRNVSLYDYSKKQFKIKFNANDGEGTMDDMLCTYGQKNILSKNAFTRNGYEFVGWAAERESDGKFRYIGGGVDGWYIEGQQPSGTQKYIYGDGHWVSQTTAVKDDTVVMHAQWRITSTLKGDVDRDGQITLSDARILALSIANGISLSREELNIYDYDADEQFDLSDVRLMISDIAANRLPEVEDTDKE